MLEKTPAAVGHALQGARAGLDRLVWADEGVAGPETVRVSSAAFEDGAVLPARFTEDGEGVSPSIAWSGAPADAASLVLVVEDADSPTPAPLVHALVYDLPAGDRALTAGALPSRGHAGQPLSLGRNSFRQAEWLPPDPPKGHGPHRYVFQVYAIDHRPDLKTHPEKHDILEALRGHVLARGVLTGTYERPG